LIFKHTHFLLKINIIFLILSISNFFRIFEIEFKNKNNNSKTLKVKIGG